MDVVFRTGSGLRRIPTELAEVLAFNLRAFPHEEGSRSAADKLELFLVGESVNAIHLTIDEKSAVCHALDHMALEREPALRQLFDALNTDVRQHLASRGIGSP
jgi:hypothetical protein